MNASFTDGHAANAKQVHVFFYEKSWTWDVHNGNYLWAAYQYPDRPIKIYSEPVPKQ